MFKKSLSFCMLALAFSWSASADVEQERLRKNRAQQASEKTSEAADSQASEKDEGPRFCKRGRHYHFEEQCKRYGLEAKYCRDDRCGYGQCGQFGKNCENLRRPSKKSSSSKKNSSSGGGSEKKSDKTKARISYGGTPGRGPCGPGVFIHPSIDGKVNSRFGTRRDPFTGRGRLHAGWDYSRPGGTPIKASAPGVVTYAGWMGGYGNTVEIKHSKDLSTRYAHMRSMAVGKGQRVKRKQVIGKVGTTGRSTGNHLHFEVLCNGKQVDPKNYVNKSVMPPLPDGPDAPLPTPRPDFERQEYEKQWKDVDVGI